jgi:hypothetical protein
MEASTSRRIDVGRVISETFSIYGSNAMTLLTSAFVVFAISGILQAVFRDEGGFVLALLAGLVSLIANALYTGFVVSLVADVRADNRRDLTAGQLFSKAQHAIAPLIGAAILAGIGITIGFILLIIPGLFLLTIWAVISPAIVIERTGVMGAFSRSHELVRGQGWPVFGAILVAFVITAVAAAIATAIGVAIGLGGLIVLLIIVGVLTAPVAALVSSILFFDLGGGAGAATPAAPQATPPPPPPAVA